MLDHELRPRASYLAKCSPDSAYKWLESQKMDTGVYRDQPISLEDNKLLEYILYRRGDPLIDLGLARFAQNPQIIGRVYDRGDVGVKCAALANPMTGKGSLLTESWLDGYYLKNLTAPGNKHQLLAYASNPNLSDEALEELILKKGVFRALSENQYQLLLVKLGKNPRLSTEYNSIYLDGWDEYSYHRVFDMAWGLIKSVPTTQIWATILDSFLQDTVTPTGFDDIETAIERWRIDNPKTDDDKYYSPGPSFFLRSRIADLLKADKDLLNSDDLALRRSFYCRFSPYKYSDWPDFLERDGEEFVEAALDNEQLWQTSEERERLQTLVWACPDPRSDMMMPNRFNGLLRNYAETKPEWFRDEEDDISDDTKAAIHRINIRLDEFQAALGIRENLESK